MKQSQISWGKIIAGAAIAAGAIAVLAFAPDFSAKVLSGTKDLATTLYDKTGDAASWLWTHIVGGADVAATKAAEAASANLGAVKIVAESTNPLLAEAAAQAKTLLPGLEQAAVETGKFASERASGLLGFAIQNKALAVGAAAAAGGIIATQAPTIKRPAAQAPHAENHDSQAFSAREDMRRMQALMMARMQATGYQPATAMAGQGRA